MKTLSTIKRDLIKKAQKIGGVWENFGDSELRKFIEEYEKTHKISLTYGNPMMLSKKHQETYRKVVEFRNWCMNFDLSQLR